MSAAPVVLGGAAFSVIPQPMLDYLGAEMGIQGEGETVFPLVLGRLQAGEKLEGIPGLYVRAKPAPARRSFARDLDLLPLPDPSLLSRSLSGGKDAPVPVQTRRGCPLSCTYCSTPTIEGKKMRWRSTANVVAWMMRWAYEGFRSFYFVDNTFNLPPSYANELCSRIISAGLEISWRCILFPGAIDPKLIEMMARAGCRETSIGFESGSHGMLQQMRKQFAPEEVRRASEMLRGVHIRRMGFLLLGGPGETQESVEESLAFAESLQLDALKLTVGVRIYPDTEVARLAKEEGLISSDQDLLTPQFYIVREIEEWIYETVARHMSLHPNWTF
jgi:radical SAM superfamily enzyme YgiQ (UPF0313 family)